MGKHIGCKARRRPLFTVSGGDGWCRQICCLRWQVLSVIPYLVDSCNRSWDVFGQPAELGL